MISNSGSYRLSNRRQNSAPLLHTITLTTMLQTSPLPYPSSCDPSLKEDGFGIVLDGIEDINNLSDVEIDR